MKVRGAQAVACGELGVRALGAPVGRLHRAEELLLEPVGALVVERLIRIAQRSERDGDLVDGLGDLVQQLLSGRIRHRRPGGRARGCGRASGGCVASSSTLRRRTVFGRHLDALVLAR